MAIGRKTGGRKKGTPNKDKVELLELIRDAVGNEEYHPVVAMAKLAHDTSTKRVKDITTGKMRTMPKVPLELRARMHQEVARYVAPQLKAIEHTAGDEAQGLNFFMGYTAEPSVSRPDVREGKNGKGGNGTSPGGSAARPRPTAGQ